MAGLFIRDWETVSPVGIGKRDFREAARKLHREGRSAVPETDPSQPAVLESFDKKAYLGKKGTRGMDVLASYATVASQLLVENHPELRQCDRSRVGVILGTGTGSLASQIDFILDVHRQQSVEWINPLQFPQTVMNCAAGQVSIWHHYTGVNATVSGGYHSGVSALEYADNALRQSRADHVLAGCAEEFSPYSRYLLPIDDRQLRRHHRLGEGCLMALVEPRNQDGRSTEVIGTRRVASLARLGPHEGVSHLIGTIGELLRSRSGLPDKFGLICYNRFSSREDEIAGAIAERFSSGAPEALICSNDFVADCLAATSGLQLALLLALGPQESDRLGLAVTFDPQGAAAVCIVELGEEQ